MKHLKPAVKTATVYSAQAVRCPKGKSIAVPFTPLMYEPVYRGAYACIKCDCKRECFKMKNFNSKQGA